MVDSFSTRGVNNISAPGKSIVVSPYRRAKDAHAAKKYLESLPFIDPTHIAVMGWSHGGETTLHVVQISLPSSTPFQAAIAYYPYCTPIYILNSPLLVLIGEKDDWTPANLCEYHLKSKKGWPELVLNVYPNAFHSFDAPYGGRYVHGHWLESNIFATLDSRKRVKAFLEKYLLEN
jgi:dienelactone hydrolase